MKITAGIKDNVPTVLIPVDIVARELGSKIITASALAARGCRVIVGHKEEIGFIGRHSGPLVWQGKELFAHNVLSLKNRTADQLVKNGSGILYIQDEGGMFQRSSWREQVIEKHQIDAMAPKGVSRLCVWGRKQKEVITEHMRHMADVVRVTGSPMFDICAPRFSWTSELSVQDIEDLSPYILVCTRFGSIAHARGIHYTFEQKMDPRSCPKSMNPRHIADIWFTKWRQDVHDFAEFVVFVKELALAQRDRILILRPHPSESELFYQHAFSQFRNVKVVREGAAINWIRTADLVIHCNCTTGIEAVLAGRPVLNFLPGEQDRSDLDVEVAREAGKIARSASDALSKAHALLSGEYYKQSWTSDAIEILNNLEREAIPLLVDETLDVIREYRIDNSKLVLPSERRSRGNGLRGYVRRLLGRRVPERTTYVAAKRGDLQLKRLEKLLEGCHENGFGGGHVRTVTSKYVVIDPS